MVSCRRAETGRSRAAEEGAAACMRCPKITTVGYDLFSQVREVSGLPVTEKSIETGSNARPARAL